MKRARALVVAAVTSVALSYLGCGAVPEIRFVDDGADGAADTGATDGPKTDGANDGSLDGAGACTTASPGGGATCCGDVWCLGECSAFNCDQCAARGCQAGELCCGKPGNVVCKTHCP